MKTFAPQLLVTNAVKPGTIQRKCGCAPGAECHCNDHDKEQDKEKTGKVQRRANNGASGTDGAVSAPVAQGIQQAARSSGHPLPGTVRRQMEAGFGGRDFSQVRVHTGSEANRLAGTLDAHAFTTGNDIFFALNRYQPESAEGKELLAHELTHVVQQGGTSAAGVQPQLELGAVSTAAEREADRAASAVVRGLTAHPVVASPPSVVQRVPAPTATSTALAGGGQAIVLPASQPLELPGQKADSQADLTFLLDLYKRAAQNHRLRTTHAGRTSGLWSVWAAGRQNLPDIGGFESRLHSKCSPDHMLELQAGGADSANNLRLLSQDRNEHAGSQIAGQLRSLKTTYGIDDSSSSWLEFTDAIVKPGTASEATADPQCLTGEEPLKEPGGATTPGAGLQTLAFVAGGAPNRTGHEASGAVPRVHRFAVAGAEMETVAPQPDGAHVIHSTISSRIKHFPVQGPRNFDFKTRGPQPSGPGNGPELYIVTTPPNTVRLDFPFLSTALLTPRLEGGQWKASGDFTPTLPVLNQTRVHLDVADEKLDGALIVNADALKRALPVPGLTIDPVSLQVQIQNGEFSASGGFGFRYGTMARGSVNASFSPRTGFEATGTVDLLIPGMDNARGEVWIRSGRFGGRLTVDASKLRFPAVQSANLTVLIGDGVLSGTGTVNLAIPGLRNTSLTFRANSEGTYSIEGTASASIPGLRDPRIDIKYENGALSGTGHAGLLIPGLENAAVELVYSNGGFSGSATLAYRRGRLTGSVTAALSREHKLSGHGELSYEIAPGLVALVGVDLLENGTARVHGQLRLPDPIILFPEKAFRKNLFSVSIDIPIFGISFGSRSVGVIANISAGLDASAGIGPGQIRGARIIASFDPNNEQGAASFQASGELYIPAYAEIAVFISGGIGVSLLIVKALGGIRATAAAGLMGALSVPIDMRYQGGRFEVNGAAELYAQPRLRFQLDAFVNVTADLFVTTIELYEKKWKLAAFEWGSDFRIGLKFPFHYVFGEPFNLSLSQIEFIAPRIDASKIIHDLLPK
jgi:hypothetical protein